MCMIRINQLRLFRKHTQLCTILKFSFIFSGKNTGINARLLILYSLMALFDGVFVLYTCTYNVLCKIELK